jgi:hypothetical protein
MNDEEPDRDWMTLAEAKAYSRHHEINHATVVHHGKAILFAERIGSDHLRLRRDWSGVCIETLDDPGLWPTQPSPFSTIYYEFDDVSHALSVTPDRARFKLRAKFLESIVDAAAWADYEYNREHIYLRKELAETACDALREGFESNHSWAIALAEIQDSLLTLWKPPTGSSSGSR